MSVKTCVEALKTSLMINVSQNATSFYKLIINGSIDTRSGLNNLSATIKIFDDEEDVLPIQPFLPVLRVTCYLPLSSFFITQKLQLEMANHMKILQQLKDYVKAAALEREERLHQEKEKQRIEVKDKKIKADYELIMSDPHADVQDLRTENVRSVHTSSFSIVLATRT